MVHTRYVHVAASTWNEIKILRFSQLWLQFVRTNTTLINTGCILTIYIRNWCVTGLFGDFWDSLRLLCDPNICQKLLLGKKYSLIRLKTSQEAVCQKEEFHSLVFWGWNSGWLKIHFFFMDWILNTIDFKTWIFLKSYIIRTLKAWI